MFTAHQSKVSFNGLSLTMPLKCVSPKRSQYSPPTLFWGLLPSWCEQAFFLWCAVVLAAPLSQTTSSHTQHDDVRYSLTGKKQGCFPLRVCHFTHIQALLNAQHLANSFGATLGIYRQSPGATFLLVKRVNTHVSSDEAACINMK